MKHQREEAQRWLRQADHDWEAAGADIDRQFFADACYSAEQAAQKALKAYLYFCGSRMVWKHSVKELVAECGQYQKEFLGLINAGKTLDQYYIPTRYPDALAPPAVPFESYTEVQAKEAIDLTKAILDLVKKQLLQH